MAIVNIIRAGGHDLYDVDLYVTSKCTSSIAANALTPNLLGKLLL